MRKRKWYERMSAAVLIAVLLVNHGDMGIMAKAETITALEENLEEENKKIEAETASASNADEKRDTTVDSNETTESDLEKETATASNGKENPATKRKMAKRAMNAETVTEETYSISQTDGKFKVVGGSLTEDGENLNSLTDAFNKILSFGTDTNININFDNVNISSGAPGAPKLTKGCELTLKGTYTSAVEAFIIGSNDTFIIHNEANITTSSYVIRRSNAKNSTVIFEQNGGTVESVDGFYMYENDVISLKEGTINGNVFGNGGKGRVEIIGGTWNGQLAYIKDIDICGGQLNNIKDDTSMIAAIKECGEVSIRGGRVFARNTEGKAFAIYMIKNTQLTISGDIDVSALGTTSGSIYYGGASTYPVINAEKVQSIGENFFVVPSDTAMKVNPVSNWIKGSKTNIEYLCEKIKLKVVNAYDTGSADKYTNYTLKAVGNYIRFVDKNASASPLKSGAIKLADITLSSDGTSYEVYYEVTTDGKEYKETVTYSAQNQKVSDILNDIVSVNTGTTGPEITIGSIGTPIEEDITIDTGSMDENKTTTLKGAITGKVNVTGSGTLQSEINCSGFYGRTNSEIHITDGQITGKENAEDAVIVLEAANLTVEGENTKIWDKSASGGDRYAIQAIGGVSVTIKGGEIKSDNHTAVYIYRSSGQKKDHATFTMEGGTIIGGVYGLRHAHLNEINLSGGTITGGANQPDVYMAREINVSETANFTVEGNFPFKFMQIESASLKNEIDFTKATVTEDKKILISSPLDANTKESYVKLFKASTSNYQNLIKHIELTGGSNPICVVYNANPVSADPTTTEIYAFSAPNIYTVHVKYYTGKDEKDPFYEEYLLNLNDGNRSYLGNISLPNGAAVWRYKENSNRNGTATDVTKTVIELVNGEMYPMGTVPEIELYAGYSVSIDASVSEEDITKDSAIIKGNTAGTTVYYTNKSDYQIYTGEELRNAAKSTEKRSDFTQVKVGEDGTFSIPLTGLDPLKKYTYYLVAENSNMDVSDSRAVTFTTKARVLTAADFQIVGDREFTYENNGATHTVTVKPAAGNEELFDIDFVVYKMKKGEEYTGSYLQPPAAAGTYGIYVTTKPKKSGIEQAKYLLIGDMTIKKAKFNPEWFNIVESITYGTEEYESLKPWIKDEYNGVGGPAVTEYGQIEYKLYNDSELAQEVLRNSDGHYDSSPDMNQDYATYYMGVTSTGGDNVEPQETPVLVGTQITVKRATNTISITSCPDIRYGETPEPKNEATDTTGGVKYTYSSTKNGEYTDWNEKNKPGTWYVKATVGKSQNYNEATSDSVEFEVSKAKLVPSVSAVKSKIYDGNTKAEGTLTLSSADGNPILSEDAVALEAKGTFTWTSKDAGTNTVDVTGIALDSQFEDRYELTARELSNVSCSGAKIENAKIQNVSVRQMMELTYNGREQLPEVTATGSTTGGTAITFRYGLTAVQAADETQALKTVPALTDAGIYTVYYTASAANHDSVSGSFEIEIKNASITGVDAAGYTGIYDGQSHGIKITLTGNAGDGEILYGESEDNCTLTESPVYKNTGSYTVYYTVTKKNFDTISGSATVAITPAQLTVTAESRNVTYKDEPPVYSSTFEGFVNGENTEVLGGTLSYECAYAAGSDVDEYEIIPSGLTAENGNYEITYQPGKLTVSQAKPEFELRNLDQLNRVYDAKNTAPEAWTDSDGNMTVTIKKGSEILTEAPMNAGTYTVEVHTEAGKNYEAGSQTFSFEIKKAPLSVKAVDQNVTVGDAIPEYKVLYEGFAGTDTADVLNGSLKFTCEYAPDSAAGDYSILPSGLTSENYEIHFENGTLHAVRRASSGSDDSDNSGGSGSTKNPAATNFGKNVSNNSSSENDAQGTWKRDNKGWWFEFKDGTYPAGEKISDQNGEKLGWIQKDGKWWAFGSDGYLKTGWVFDGASGKWYLLNEKTGMQIGWYYDESGRFWYYLDPASGAMLTGWQFINGKWYYLSKTSGAVPLGSMYREIRTPDGYYVDKDGAWDGLEAKEK
ncbi:Autolysin [uncultured Clostridium sp.]|nr:Autolysin [uncultured Clostridium sp.]